MNVPIQLSAGAPAVTHSLLPDGGHPEAAGFAEALQAFGVVVSREAASPISTSPSSARAEGAHDITSMIDVVEDVSPMRGKMRGPIDLLKKRNDDDVLGQVPASARVSTEPTQALLPTEYRASSQLHRPEQATENGNRMDRPVVERAALFHRSSETTLATAPIAVAPSGHRITEEHGAPIRPAIEIVARSVPGMLSTPKIAAQTLLIGEPLVAVERARQTLASPGTAMEQTDPGVAETPQPVPNRFRQILPSGQQVAGAETTPRELLDAPLRTYRTEPARGKPPGILGARNEAAESVHVGLRVTTMPATEILTPVDNRPERPAQSSGWPLRTVQAGPAGARGSEGGDLAGRAIPQAERLPADTVSHVGGVKPLEVREPIVFRSSAPPFVGVKRSQPDQPRTLAATSGEFGLATQHSPVRTMPKVRRSEAPLDGAERIEAQPADLQPAEGVDTASRFAARLDVTTPAISPPQRDPFANHTQPDAKPPSLAGKLIAEHSSAPTQRAEWLTVRFEDGEAGSMRMRVAVLGESVRASIVHESERVAEQLRSNVQELKQSLGDKGFGETRLTIRGAAQSSSVVAPAAYQSAGSNFSHGHANEQDGHQRHHHPARDSDDRGGRHPHDGSSRQDTRRGRER